MSEYIYRDGEMLRCGYTTGSCAAAAAKAAEMLLSGELVSEAVLVTPGGAVLTLEILDVKRTGDYVSCAVRKDGGDDPDVTNGLLIYSSVRKIPNGVDILGGKGVGRVTKAGLDQPVGEAAINSVPRKMIAEAVSDIARKHGYEGGFEVTVSVPCGEDIAAKTFNPRLGIVGGISILGTTGIVEPMSNSAVLGTIRAEEKMRRAEGKKSLLLTVGNYSKSFLAEEMPIMLDKSVMCSNFIGDGIDIAMELGFERLLIIGHIGKLCKLGAGIMNTHSSMADGRMEVLVTCGVSAGVRIDVLKMLPDCATVDAALELLDNVGMREKTAAVLMERIEYYLKAKAKGVMDIGAVTFSYKYGIIGKTSSAEDIIGEITEEYK
ncbi:MAG: cobalt-precorrin-5B (C(1))-methyltransferase CbiD [Oscillospiraceae bacterium]|nr:cobalt-precorrin-5B (C(1))-methyltransferase CbiD [Oscillospiraceae bacterium]